MSAARAPGTQPAQVRIKTNRIEPQPLSITAKGGNSMHSNTLPHPIRYSFTIPERKAHKPVFLQYTGSKSIRRSMPVYLTFSPEKDTQKEMVWL